MISMAFSGHDVSQALQSTQSSKFPVTLDFPSSIEYMFTGHTSTHVPQPLHFSVSMFISTIFIIIYDLVNH